MKIRLIKVYEDDYDYNYENTFIVKDNEESLKKLYELQEELDELDYEEREEKYNTESKIDIIENFIVKNFETLNCERTEIDCY